MFLRGDRSTSFHPPRSARSLHPKLFHRKNFIPRTDIIQNYRVGGCQTLNLDLVLCRKDRQPPSTFGIIYRAVTHDRTNFGQALKVVAVSLHDDFFAVGHRLYEGRARQNHFAQEVGHLLLLVADAASRVVTSIINRPMPATKAKRPPAGGPFVDSWG